MIPKISESELEVMRMLWREARPLSFTEIRTELECNKNWSKSTIQTLVVRLREKGAVDTETNYVTLYRPAVSEQEYLLAEEQLFLDKLYKGSAKKLVASLCENGQLSESDIDELKQFFKMEDSHE